MKKIFQVIKNRWAEYVIEILVIIIGISLSFFFNNLKENRVERKEEVKLLESIHENLVIDTIALTNQLQISSVFIKGHEQFLSPEIDTFPADSILRYLDYLITYTRFQGRDISYEALRQSKRSTIIRNRLLLQEIIQHYEHNYGIVKEWNNIDKNFVLNDVLPFLSENMKYREGKFLYNDVETTLKLLKEEGQFKNMVKSGAVFKQIIKIYYNKNLSDTKVLMKKVEAELETLK
jgi:hypothetical protein